MELPEEVLIYVAENITSNVRQIEGTVKKILAFRDLLGNNVDASSVTRAVRDMFKETSDILPTAEVIIEEVGKFYDIDPAAVALANANAKLAGVEKRCHFEVADVADFAARSEAIVLTNPPYGERMSTIEGAAKLARTLGQQMEAHPCAGVYAITADMDFEHHYGKRANKRRKMYNGMIPCQLYMYYNAPKFENRPAKPMPKSGFDGKRTQPGHTSRFEKK